MKHLKKVGFIILIAIYFLRLYNINIQYPRVETTLINSTEGTNINGLDIKFSSLSFNSNKYTQDLPKEYDNHNTKIITIDITITNNTAIQQEFPLYSFILQSGVWNNSINQGLFFQINSHMPSMYISVDPKKTNHFVLPYICSNTQMKQSRWANFENNDFQIVLFQYPIKIIWNI